MPTLEPTPKPKVNRNVLITNLVLTVIRGAVTIGAVVLFAKAIEKVNSETRTEFVPGQNGRLIANEYRREALAKVRYATKEETWQYSKALLDERLNEMKLI